MNIRKECERRGWSLLNERPALECESEEAFYGHGEETSRIIAEFERKAADERGCWQVTRRYIDFAHEDRKVRCRFVEPYGLQDCLEAADLKNGVDAVIGADGTLLLIANGQGYTKGDAHGFVTEVFECRLLSDEKAQAASEMA